MRLNKMAAKCMVRRLQLDHLFADGSAVKVLAGSRSLTSTDSPRQRRSPSLRERLALTLTLTKEMRQ